ncbi:MAG: hypothetical protein EBT92_17275 [Planctomycetes bacterium]|nr:hypothetical protein [Planctomycetota bacterium]NBY01344.1 hypothetical protein [Planctomycetota bacterium]
MTSLHELRAPSEDGGILFYPNLSLAAELIKENQKKLSNAQPLIFDLPLKELRLLAKDEAISAAIAFLKSNQQEIKVDEGLPLLVSGHQPELFHPGVWIKNFALNKVSKRYGLTPLNLVIDNDVVKHASISVPMMPVGLKKSLVVDCNFDKDNSGMPYEDWTIKNHEIFGHFSEHLKALTFDWENSPMGVTFWQDVLKAVATGLKPGLAFTHARRKWEQHMGCNNLELPVSTLCGTKSFSLFAMDIISKAEGFANLFNQAVASYRKKHGLKSKNHPFPDLGVAKGWAETPFWLLLPGESRRQRLGVKKEATGEIILGTPGPQGVRINLGAKDQLSALRNLEIQGTRVRPRALSTTIFARLILSDAFIHGIGGAKYDEVTDQMIQDFYHVTPPAFMVVSATARLNLIKNLETESSIKGANQLARDIWWNPQRHTPAKPDPQWEALVVQRQKLLALPCNTHIERKERYQKLRANLDHLRVWIKSDYEQEVAKAKYLQGQFKNQQLLQSREYSFVLHSEQKLKSLFKPFL